MRKLTLSVSLLFGLLLLGTPTLSLAAAHGGGGGHAGGGGHSSGGGGGHASFSGGGGHAVSSVGVGRGTGYGGGGYRGGYGGYRGGYGYGFGLGFGLGYGFGYPYYGYYGYGYPYYDPYDAYPAYDSGYYDDPGPQAYSQPAYSQPAAPAPTVNVYTPPPAREYQAPPAGRDASSQSNMYLFAFPDGSVQVAVAYWTENGTLHYVTRDKQQKSVPLSSIDQSMTMQLNRERGVTLMLR